MTYAYDQLAAAARALLADARRRCLDDDLRCPHMRALEEAVQELPTPYGNIPGPYDPSEHVSAYARHGE